MRCVVDSIFGPIPFSIKEHKARTLNHDADIRIQGYRHYHHQPVSISTGGALNAGMLLIHLAKYLIASSDQSQV